MLSVRTTNTSFIILVPPNRDRVKDFERNGVALILFSVLCCVVLSFVFALFFAWFFVLFFCLLFLFFFYVVVLCHVWLVFPMPVLHLTYIYLLYIHLLSSWTCIAYLKPFPLFVMINEKTMLIIDCIRNIYKTNILSLQSIRKKQAFMESYWPFNMG